MPTVQLSDYERVRAVISQPFSETPRVAQRTRSYVDYFLDRAVEAGVITMIDEHAPVDGLCFTWAELALLKLILFNEDYATPVRAPAPTDTAPASDARIDEYARRLEAGEKLFSSLDANARREDDRSLAVAPRSNGDGVKILGWHDGYAPADVVTDESLPEC